MTDDDDTGMKVLNALMDEMRDRVVDGLPPGIGYVIMVAANGRLGCIGNLTAEGTREALRGHGEIPG